MFFHWVFCKTIPLIKLYGIALLSFCWTMNITIESFGKSIHVIQLYVLFINDGLIVVLILVSLNPWFTTLLNTLKLHINGSICWVMFLHEIVFFIFYSLINSFMLIVCSHIWSKNFHLVMTPIDSLLCSCMMILHIIWRIQI